MKSFIERMIGAAKLDVHTYEEVETDTGATTQALAVVVLASIALGIGSVNAGGGLLGGALAALVGWVVWASIVYLIGTKLLPEPQTRSDVGELLRTTGFSASPGLLRALGFVPGLGQLIIVAASIWMLVAMVVAVRQALDYSSTGRAVAVCLIGWLFQFGVMLLIYLAFAD